MVIGQVLRSRYKIVRHLGNGSFGVTYLAEDLDLPGNPLCVVKHLKQNREPRELKLARKLFNREAEALYSLGNKCSQIPRLFAHFEENGQFFLVQEFIDGHDLSKEIFPGKKWSEAEVQRLLQEILEILATVHSQNIIHRDIKVQNIMRRKIDGKLVLIDFGAVKDIQGLKVNSQGQTIASVIIGTGGYMPSEQANGHPKLSSDVYAVGMVGIYALTGIRPVGFHKHPETGEVMWLSFASVSPHFASVLNKMVRYHFNSRYQTAGEALQALTLSPTLAPSVESLPPSPKQLLTAPAKQQLGFLRSPSPDLLLTAPRKRQLGFLQTFLIGIGVGASLLFGVGLLFMNFSRVSQPNSEQAQPEMAETVTDVQLFCAETPVTVSANIPPKTIGKATFYGFVNDSGLTGKGIVVFPDKKFGGNARYEGELNKGVFHGCGNYTRSNGERYIGQFVNGQFQGIGKYIFLNGCRYIGELKNNQFDGRGTCVLKDNSRLSGIWQKGKLQGSGKTCSCS